MSGEMKVSSMWLGRDDVDCGRRFKLMLVASPGLAFVLSSERTEMA